MQNHALSEAPIYFPSTEQFLDPFAFISSIKAEAEKFGICKIVPPEGWKPPFAPCPKKFKFQTKRQDLSLLEGENRQRHNFDQKLRMQLFSKGAPLLRDSPPGKVTLMDVEVDLYGLHKAVKKSNSPPEKLDWKGISRDAEFPEELSEMLRNFYSDFLHHSSARKTKAAAATAAYEPSKKVGKKKTKHSRAGRYIKSGESFWCYRSEYGKCVWGVVHKSPTSTLKVDFHESPNCIEAGYLFSEGLSKARLTDLILNGVTEEQATKVYTGELCEVCGLAEVAAKLLTCSKCGRYFHSDCNGEGEIERELDWFCEDCCNDAELTPQFGFENGGCFTLIDFIENSKLWMKSYYEKVGLSNEPSEEQILKEFWKLVGSDSSHGICPLYGSDLDTSIVGSGFPTKQNLTKVGEIDYSNDPWNLNLLPTSDRSLLRHLGRRVTGVTIPWLYVGSLFSAFCWHNEDHHLYSINYHHFGSPKQWYGVPGKESEEFEKLAASLYPDLFELFPDLLHHLVTMINPSVLSSKGLSVCSCTQRAGEFVVTFPRAYHAGFNMGPNCAEAVNLAPTDWLPFGWKASQRLRMYCRPPVFSQDGLALALARNILSGRGRTKGESRELKNLTGFLVRELERMVGREEEGSIGMCWKEMEMELFYKRLEIRKGRKNKGTRSVKSQAVEEEGNGPRCFKCQTFCFNEVVICEDCALKKGLGKKATVCALHAELTCACPPSSRVVFIRNSPSDLNAITKGLMELHKLKGENRKRKFE